MFDYNENNFIFEIDIEQLLNNLDIEIVKKTADSITCLCPFHAEKTASFGISLKFEKYGVYNCFGCHASGNLFTLVKSLTGQSLYSYFGIKQEKQDKHDFNFNKEVNVMRKKAINKLTKVVEEKRNIKRDFEIVATVCYPLDDSDCAAYCRKRKIEKEDIDEYEMFYIKHGYIGLMLFSNRLIIPIKDRNGNIISYEGRYIYPIDKNSKIRKCLYPRNSKIGSTIFDYHKLDFDKSIIWVEGILDVIQTRKACRSEKYNYQVSSFFGIEMSNSQIDIVNQFSNTAVMFDRDDAGFRGIEIYESKYKYLFEIILLPENDPNDSSIQTIQKAIDSKISIQNFYMNKYNICQPKVIEW